MILLDQQVHGEHLDLLLEDGLQVVVEVETTLMELLLLVELVEEVAVVLDHQTLEWVLELLTLVAVVVVLVSMVKLVLMVEMVSSLFAMKYNSRY